MTLQRRQFENTQEIKTRIEYATLFELQIARKNTQDIKMRLDV